MFVQFIDRTAGCCESIGSRDETYNKSIAVEPRTARCWPVVLPPQEAGGCESSAGHCSPHHWILNRVPFGAYPLGYSGHRRWLSRTRTCEGTIECGELTCFFILITIIDRFNDVHQRYPGITFMLRHLTWSHKETDQLARAHNVTAGT